MKLVSQTSNSATVELTVDELVTLANALNEALEGIEEWEFHPRIGVNRDEAESLRAAVAAVLPHQGQTPPQT